MHIIQSWQKLKWTKLWYKETEIICQEHRENFAWKLWTWQSWEFDGHLVALSACTSVHNPAIIGPHAPSPVLTAFRTYMSVFTPVSKTDVQRMDYTDPWLDWSLTDKSPKYLWLIMLSNYHYSKPYEWEQIRLSLFIKKKTIWDIIY